MKTTPTNCAASVQNLSAIFVHFHPAIDTTEGQQRLDNHTDKLLNYIRYWQASGESIKTSIRTKTRMGQIAQAGLYFGGKVAYGYRLVKKGRMNKKGYEIHDIEVNPCEAETVKQIFSKYVYEGYGLQRLSRFLIDSGIRKASGERITLSAVRGILRNTLYIGVITCGEVCSDVIPELRIVEDDLFQQAQKLREERATAVEATKTRTLPLNTKGQSLLAGNVFCACCGGRLTLSVGKQSYTRKKDGVLVEKKQIRYVCTGKLRKIRDCNGQSTYSMKKLDGIVSQLLSNLFQNVQGASESELIEKSYLGELESYKAKLKGAKAELVKQSASLKTLQGEVVGAIQGTSRFDPELLNDLIRQTKEQVDATTAEITRLESDLENKQQYFTAIQANYEKLISWSELFQDASIETRKMITAYLIDNVKVGRGYELNLQFSVSFEQFFSAA